jgi:hypothetical protein
VRVKQFSGGAEQRWRVSAGFLKFEIGHTNLRWDDVLTLRNFFESQGLFGTWSLPIGATTYNGCIFTDKVFQSRESKRGLIDVSLKARQVLPESTIAHPTIGAAQPSFPSGLIQIPYSVTKRFNAIVSDRETGPRYGYAYDSQDLVSFDVTLGALTQTELNTLTAFWATVGGKWAPFSFTDPDTGTTYTNMRFDMDELAFNRLAPNVFSSSFRLTEKR